MRPSSTSASTSTPFQPANVLDHHQSARSSVTVLEAQLSPSSPLDEEIADDEARMERYGGDDVREPSKLSHKKQKEDSTFPAPESEPSPVTWDGPNDSENPQNWSHLRKWFLTVLISALTVNV